MMNEKDYDKYRDGTGSRAETDIDNDINYTEGAYSDSAADARKGSGSAGDGRYAGGYQREDGHAGEYRREDRYGGPEYRRVDHSYIPEEPDRPRRRRGSVVKRTAGLVAAGILFGCVAGGTMAGVNLLSGRMIQNQSQSAAVQPETSRATLGTVPQSETPAAVPASTGNDVSAIVDKAMPSVVAINNTVVYTQDNLFFGKQQYTVPSSGSGIIAGQNDNELLIVTNNHVVEDSEDLSVTFIDGTSVKAAVKGTDSDSDLAVIAVQFADIPEETKSEIAIAQLGDSDTLKLGQGVVAIGNALGQGQSVTVGYVSALNKTVKIGGVERTLLQVDAAINPGNSGGALLNMQGEVIGINAAKYSDTDVEGIGYAIPISFAKDIIEELMNKTTKVEVAEEEQGYLGIQLQNIDSQMSQAYGMPQGIYVYKIVEGGAAADSDLRERDIITKFDGETVKTGADLQKLLTYYKGGTTVTLTVQSLENGAYVERNVEVTLGYKTDQKTSDDISQQDNEDSRIGLNPQGRKGLQRK